MRLARKKARRTNICGCAPAACPRHPAGIRSRLALFGWTFSETKLLRIVKFQIAVDATVLLSNLSCLGLHNCSQNVAKLKPLGSSTWDAVERGQAVVTDTG
jgi:hypothetical protein